MRRPVGELLVLLFAGTVCAVLVLSVAGIIYIEITDPDTDTAGPAALVSDVINTLIGLLAGFIAGRTDARRRDPDG